MNNKSIGVLLLIVTVGLFQLLVLLVRKSNQTMDLEENLVRNNVTCVFKLISGIASFCFVVDFFLIFVMIEIIFSSY